MHSSQQHTTFTGIWESNRERLRRLLVGLSKNIDLADDLLQEAYVCALKGFASFRGDDVRPWLTAIARNAYLSHIRRRYVSLEEPLAPELSADTTSDPQENLPIWEIRQAIDSLPPALRTALFMKHYGGFSYQEIADHFHCSIDSAKRRVSRALALMREKLRVIKEATIMRCDAFTGARTVDFLYSKLSAREVSAMKEHLKGCPKCRERAEEFRDVLVALDQVEGEYTATDIVEIDANGNPIHYTWLRTMNGTGDTLYKTGGTVDRDFCIDYAMVQGQEVVLERSPFNQSQDQFETTLPQPVKPNESYDRLFIIHPTTEKKCVERLGNGRQRYYYYRSPNADRDWIYALTIRLPCGAQLVAVDNQPTEVKIRDATTSLLWKCMLHEITEPLFEGQSRLQFECTVEYQLPGDSME